MIKFSNEDAYKVPYDMMTKSGIWPEENPGFVYKMKTSSNWLFAIGLLIVQLLQAIDDIGDFANLSQSLYIMTAMLGYIIKLAVFTCRRNKFLNMVNFLKDPIFAFNSEDYEYYLIKNIRRANLTANTFKYLYTTCVFFYLIYPLVDHVPLPFPFPYDLRRYTILMYAFQIVAESYAAWNNACLDSLCACMMGVAVAQLEILAEKIIRVKQNHASSEDIILRRLKYCVEHHLAIIKYTEYVEEIFKIGILLQLMASILIICNTLFYLMLITFSAQFFLMLNFSVAMFIQLFAYCWFGNEIILKSQKIGDACYEFNWYSSGNEIRMHIFIMMERSKRPLRITAMKFATLSLATFASILQWSYSCLALLLDMYNKRSA